ncbi:MAG: hypothetical protein ACTHK2_12025 [Dokdonella sp.]|uniref:hypothetical protein n=1 Tax=Dokdonella sp. TaxID=2291710 RepID=UPI003F823248
MPLELRYAGLDATMEQRLRLATQALAAHRLQARAAAWDGTRCDVVAADPRDAYGSRVLDIARRRGTPVLEVVEAVATVVRLTRALHDLLSKSPSLSTPAAVPVPPAASPLLRLATDASLRGVDVELRRDGAVVWLLCTKGRVVSASVSDRMRACEQLATGDWSLAAIGDRQRTRPPGEISASLDAFLLTAAWSARASLPPYPDEDVGLRDWPDLGGAGSIAEALVVVQSLQRFRGTPGTIAHRHGLARAEVDACLWAFQAAGLLDRAAAVEFAAPPPRNGGLFSRLAAHFGLRVA